MLDRYGRVINYLRISVTDRCNLRCCYCMPEGVQDVGMKNILTFEEIWEIVRTGVSLGITHIRITGGEPLVRKGCVNLIRGIREIPGVETITMTTNGVLLGNYAKQLKEAGVDGVNISLDTLDPEEFYKHVSLVSQDFIKYELSVRENVGIGDGKNMEDTDKICKLLKQVGLKEFTSRDSVNQLLGSEFGGRDLSTGQWQKLAIARGILKESSVIFLDEPTAALDPLMETSILKMFLQIAQGKTAIIVSHRIGICKNVDKIIVMKDGEIAEIGKHQELLDKRGEYYRLYTMQQKWYQ